MRWCRMYDRACAMSPGLNGKTGETTIAAGTSGIQATWTRDRLVTVEFDTNVNPALPWKFKAVGVHDEGASWRKIAEAVFRRREHVRNKTSCRAGGTKRSARVHKRHCILIKQSAFVLLITTLA